MCGSEIVVLKLYVRIEIQGLNILLRLSSVNEDTVAFIVEFLSRAI